MTIHMGYSTWLNNKKQKNPRRRRNERRIVNILIHIHPIRELSRNIKESEKEKPIQKRIENLKLVYNSVQ